MKRVTIVTTYYPPHDGVPEWARCYTSEWVDRLYRGIARNTKHDFRFVCLTKWDEFGGEEPPSFKEEIEVMQMEDAPWDRALKQWFLIRCERMIGVGLDTVIVGNIDELMEYNGTLATIRDVYTRKASNSVVLAPYMPELADLPGSDMASLDEVKHEWIDELFPGKILSYKAEVVGKQVMTTRPSIVYFHGTPKQHQVTDSWIRNNWK